MNAGLRRQNARGTRLRRVVRKDGPRRLGRTLARGAERERAVGHIKKEPSRAAYRPFRNGGRSISTIRSSAPNGERS